jgi:hypothetical protein
MTPWGAARLCLAAALLAEPFRETLAAFAARLIPAMLRLAVSHDALCHAVAAAATAGVRPKAAQRAVPSLKSMSFVPRRRGLGVAISLARRAGGIVLPPSA